MNAVKLAALAAVLTLVAGLPQGVRAQQQTSVVTVGAKSIGGVVSSPKGREAAFRSSRRRPERRPASPASS